jgi:hypothetical protein
MEEEEEEERYPAPDEEGGLILENVPRWARQAWSEIVEAAEQNEPYQPLINRYENRIDMARQEFGKISSNKPKYRGAIRKAQEHEARGRARLEVALLPRKVEEDRIEFRRDIARLETEGRQRIYQDRSAAIFRYLFVGHGAAAIAAMGTLARHQDSEISRIMLSVLFFGAVGILISGIAVATDMWAITRSPNDASNGNEHATPKLSKVSGFFLVMSFLTLLGNIGYGTWLWQIQLGKGTTNVKADEIQPAPAKSAVAGKAQVKPTDVTKSTISLEKVKIGKSD